MANTYVQGAWKTCTEGMLITLLDFRYSLLKNNNAVLDLIEANKDVVVEVFFTDTGLEFDDPTKDVKTE